MTWMEGLNLPKLRLTGRLISKAGSSVKKLVTYLPAIEVQNYFSIARDFPNLEFIYEAIKNTTNSKKVDEIQSDIKNELLSNTLGCPLSLTVILDSKPTLLSSKDGMCVEYDFERSFIAGNLLVLTAMLKSLGIKTPLFSSRMSAAEIHRNSVFRQMLAKEEIIITLVFDDECGITEDQVKDFFFKYNRQNSGLHLTQFSQSDQTFPLQPLVNQLIQDLDLDKYGGVSTKSKHVKTSDNFLTTEYILFKFLVGAVAGAQVQEVSKMSDDVTFAKGQQVSITLSNGYVENIEAFLITWLEPLKLNLKGVRSGFRLSAQIWQALALVVYQLVQDDASIETIAQAGLILGELDYSKKAKHWHNCEVMGLDSNGRLFKNSVNSTREFRNGLASYFLSLVN